MAEKTLGQQFVVDIITKYRDDGLKQAQEAQAKLKEVLNASTAALGATQKATTTYTTGLGALTKSLQDFRKYSWEGVAIGGIVSKTFLGIADWAEQATARVAAFGEELYYMNRRLGQPGTSGLFNLAFAGQQIGLSPAQTLGSLESMGAAIRTNPGLAGLLGRFLPGYTPGGAVGAEQQLGLVNSLKSRWGENGYFVASQFAEQFGMDEHTFRQMWTNLDELNEQYKVHGERLKEFGLNTDASSKSFAAFNKALNSVIDILDIQATKIGAFLANWVGTPALNTLATASSSSATSWGAWFEGIFRGATSGNSPVSTGNPTASGGIDRTRFAKELADNPNLKNKILSIAAGENLNPIANQAVLESMMNRASMMGTSLSFEARRTSEGGYYAGYNAQALTNPALAAMLEKNLQAVLAGSDVSHGATDNASGAFARSRTGMFKPTFSAGGETFFVPNSVQARGWSRYGAWRSAQMHLDNSGASDTSPSGTDQNFQVTHTTNITVNGNADMGVMKDAGSILGQDRWDAQLRQAVRGANVR